MHLPIPKPLAMPFNREIKKKIRFFSSVTLTHSPPYLPVNHRPSSFEIKCKCVPSPPRECLLGLCVCPPLHTILQTLKSAKGGRGGLVTITTAPREYPLNHREIPVLRIFLFLVSVMPPVAFRTFSKKTLIGWDVTFAQGVRSYNCATTLELLMSFHWKLLLPHLQ